MKTVMVRYRVKPECVAENEALIAKVYEELAVAAPNELRYQTYKLDDGVSFLHIARVPNEGPSPLRDLDAFDAFVREVGDRCDDPPVTTVVSALGFYASS